ncbi:hypothetical protein J5N97_021107 [Dioscorea zingiberensis]|uniref:Uncharacterized protein n=1 Tax=Dioscorea zingiberensis TaxID=325984 RepID=A0A9D5CIH6_9LILI|nr:hypothetical protein J5N97_021107 [Dioscorea zingiberensis]
MNVLKKLQLDLLSLLKRSDLPIISCGMEQDWFDHYMDVTITLLDLCNSIKSAMSATHRYRMAVGLAIEGLSRSDDLSSRIATLNTIIECERSGREQQKKSVLHARMMGDCTKTCNLMALKGYSKKHDKSLGIIILAAKSAMLVVSLLIVSCIVSPVLIEMEGERVFTSKFPELRMFKEMLVALVVEGVVEDKERFQSGVELLRSKSAELSECVEMFDAVVDDVFNVVMRGRNEMLGVLKDKGLQL